MNKIAARTAIQSPTTLGLTLKVILDELYGEDWIDWDPTTIFLELRDDLNADPATEVMDRIASLQTLLGTDAFFTRPEGFLNIANTLASGSPGFTVFDPVTVPEAAWALLEAAIIREFLPFNRAVKGIVQATLADDGYTDDYPPVFDLILGQERPVAVAVLDALETDLRDQASSGVEEYVQSNLEALLYQFRDLGMTDRLSRLLSERNAQELMHTREEEINA